MNAVTVAALYERRNSLIVPAAVIDRRYSEEGAR